MPPLLSVRREPFEYGLLPLKKLIFTDGTATLRALKAKFLQNSFRFTCKANTHEEKVSVIRSSQRVNSESIAKCLDLPQEEARLVVETLGSVLPDAGNDPLCNAAVGELESVGADVDDLTMFLYLQSYKRLLPKLHKDSAALGDVWPSNSAFDGCLSALSPLHPARSARRFMPSQADEELHQVSYIEKHLLNILSLLAEPTEEDQIETQVLSIDRFERLQFLFSLVEADPKNITFSQITPFFANSDPDMPAAPVPVTQVSDWILNHIVSAQEDSSEKSFARSNGSLNTADPDVTMMEALPGSTKIQQSGHLNQHLQQLNLLNPRGLMFVEGISQASIVKQRVDVDAPTIKVLNCHDAMVYILAPVKYATIYGCSDSTVVLGAVSKAVRVEHCERVHVITATRRICISNCRDCVFYLGVNQRPLIIGDNHKLQVAPYNTCYSQLETHLSEVGIDPNVNLWAMPLALGMVDPHDSLSHAAGVADGKSESATELHPDQFTIFVIPQWLQSQSGAATNEIPFALPDAFIASQRRKSQTLQDMQRALRNVQLQDNKRKELSNAIHLRFRDWLQASGNIRQLYSLQNGSLQNED
eukprot:TRINITY_DN27350_c0_g1_i1.p1 TRINITY_DN27350_c0_g1~~TRINITY_DN27350_c0_g1_i1.p1  ORF type:complete len:588 (-),score=93.67 TRINITY_DN27350_c0_g1_i1:39-1802(-)